MLGKVGKEWSMNLSVSGWLTSISIMHFMGLVYTIGPCLMLGFEVKDNFSLGPILARTIWQGYGQIIPPIWLVGLNLN